MKMREWKGTSQNISPQYIHSSNKGKQDLFGEWMDNIGRLDAYMIGKPTDMKIDMKAWIIWMKTL